MGSEFGAESVESATSQQDRNRLWRARHEAYYAGLALRPGSKGFVTDVCVPISNLARCIAETKADIENTDLIAPILGHVGDANFHVSFFIDPPRNDEGGKGGNGQSELVVLFGRQRGNAARIQRAKPPPDGPHHHGRDALGRCARRHPPRVPKEPAPARQHLTLAAGKTARQVVLQTL